MLCGSMFTAHLLLIVGLYRTENEVKRVLLYCRSTLLHHTGCLFSHCCVATLSVSSDVNVDANGGCGLVCDTSRSVHSRSKTLHCFLHHSKLW